MMSRFIARLLVLPLMVAVVVLVATMMAVALPILFVWLLAMNCLIAFIDAVAETWDAFHAPAMALARDVKKTWSSIGE